jgi:hypothetical protein
MALSNPNLVYAGTDAGICKTVDGGATWNVTGAAGLIPLSLVMDPTNPEILVNPNHTHVLFVGTEGAGVFQSTDEQRLGLQLLQRYKLAS